MGEGTCISVIVPIYNTEKYLDACITSIVNQTYSALQIILVDDGSPDKCGIICDTWVKKDNRIQVIHQGKRWSQRCQKRRPANCNGRTNLLCGFG